MSSRVTYNLFGFYNGDPDGEQDLRRRAIPEWRLPEALHWALVTRAVDQLVVSRHTDQQPSSGPLICHHVCSDAACPGGCDDPS